MATVTQWFSCKTPPVHEGEYEFRATAKALKAGKVINCEGPEVNRIRFAGGEFFLVGTLYKYSASDCALNYYPERFEWRGLASPARTPLDEIDDTCDCHSSD
jgi:hypothetical protein